MLRYLLLIALCSVSASVVAEALSVDAAAKSAPLTAIEQACTDLILDYAYYRDRPDADAFADLFAEDAELRVLGQEYVGREAIGDRLRNAAGGPVFRHMMSTIRVFVQDDSHARGVSYVTVYSAAGGTLPRPLTQPLGVGEYHDDFVRTDEGWKIQRREFVPVFLPAP